MFWNNKQKQDEIIGKSLASISIINLLMSEDFTSATFGEKAALSREYREYFNTVISPEFSKNSILATLEMYTFINTFTDILMSANNVDRVIRQLFFDSSWGDLSIKSRWPNLDLPQEIVNEYCDDRTKNYAYIFMKHKECNMEYFHDVANYQTQLFSSLLRKNELSYFNPAFYESMVGAASEWQSGKINVQLPTRDDKHIHSHFETDALVVHFLSVALHEFFVTVITKHTWNREKIHKKTTTRRLKLNI